MQHRALGLAVSVAGERLSWRFVAASTRAVDGSSASREYIITPARPRSRMYCRFALRDFGVSTLKKLFPPEG
jgi:hypothetical protein